MARPTALDPPPSESDPLARLSNPKPLIRAGLIGFALLLLTLGGWLALAPVGGAAIAPGEVKIDLYRKTIQHQEGGLVAEVLVRDGSQVKAGDTLLVLRDVRVDASRELIQTQLDAEQAKAARLAAEQSGADTIRFPSEWEMRAGDPRLEELRTRERLLFETRRTALLSQLQLIRRQIEATKDEIRARDSQLAADSRAIRVQREDLQANQRLLTAGFVSHARLLALQRSVSELESRHADTRAERALAESRITDLRLRAETLQDSFMQEAAGLFTQVSAQIFDLRDRLRPLEDASMRQHITAPIAGEVVDLRVTGPGTVIAPREPILDIVPAGAELIIEARVQPADISQVHAGQTADVRLTAFRMRITPTVEGKVGYVSADSLFDQTTKSTYYLARIRVTEAALMEAGGLRLQAGMPAEVYIRTTERTPIQYLLDPVNAFLQRAMREH